MNTLTLVGCAHSPQQLSPQPKLTTQLAPVGRGQPVVVRVVDGRPSPTLGTRGGMYPETSAISVSSADLIPKLQAQASLLVVPEKEKAPLLEGIYRTRLKQQPPAEWKDLSDSDRTAKLRDGVIKFWSGSDVLLRQLGQDRAISDNPRTKGSFPTHKQTYADIFSRQEPR